MELNPIKVTAEPRGLEMEIDRQKFALALKTWRLRQGLTQRDVAAKFCSSRETINRAERGKPISWTQAYRLFAHLAQELKNEADN